MNRIYQHRHPSSREKIARTRTSRHSRTAGVATTLVKDLVITMIRITIGKASQIPDWTCRHRSNRVEKDVKFQAVIHPRYHCILPYRDILLNPR